MSVETQGEPLPTGLKASGELGVFVFLVSEGLLFGALILGYTVMRLSPGADFAGASKELSLLLGTLNTCVLLTSSLAAALATMWADGKRDGYARIAILVTAALGLVFLCIKSYEWFDEAQKGLLPFRDVSDRYPKASPQEHREFFDAYLVLTGTHGLHLISGIGLMLGITVFWKHLVHPAHTLKMAALYWHFIDVIWVFLFPLLYLVR
ncbi:MAG TPA: cytochrome c oxidase subunit 3 [Roseateles sp.]|jgi:cytochrome c oxidase subunit 3|nr:cytochrome c oxidase subunit 3 [Roseateles sp.]HWV00914.1 cytochrome c oxidase subunit 3 [Devosia sp.]